MPRLDSAFTYAANRRTCSVVVASDNLARGMGEHGDKLGMGVKEGIGKLGSGLGFGLWSMRFFTFAGTKNSAKLFHAITKSIMK